jgi:hypothetical protein
MAESVEASSRHEHDTEYRSVEPWAVGGLILGLVSPLAMLGGLVTLVAPLGIGVNLAALVRLKSDASRTGRTAALVGLALAVAFSVAPLARWRTDHLLLANQPRAMADAWFEHLRHDEPQLAFRLTINPDYRPPADDGLWQYYRVDEEARNQLRAFVNEPLVRRLLALGTRAQVRFYKTGVVAAEGSLAGVEYMYTVTYADQDGKKTTFFATLVLDRNATKNPELNPWKVKTCFGGLDPAKRAR